MLLSREGVGLCVCVCLFLEAGASLFSNLKAAEIKALRDVGNNRSINRLLSDVARKELRTTKHRNKKNAGAWRWSHDTCEVSGSFVLVSQVLNIHPELRAQ